MLRKIKGKKKGQNTAEYAILISLVVGAVIAMQTYVQRGLQAKMRDAVADYMISEISDVDDTGMSNTVQYEPYYLSTQFNVDRKSEQTIRMDNSVSGTGQFGTANIVREIDGYQSFSYNTEVVEGTGVIKSGI